MTSGRCAAWLAICLGWVWCASAVMAQEHVVHHRDGDRALVSVRVTPHTGMGQPGGLGFLYVEAQNQDGDPHVVQIELASRQWAGCNVDVDRTITLGPQELGRFHLPLPTVERYRFALNIRVDGKPYEDSLPMSSRMGPSLLLLGDNPKVEPKALALAQNLWPTSGRRKPGVTKCEPRNAPRDWRLYTGFPLVVLDSLSQQSRIDRDLQEALRRFVHAGGRLLVLSPDRLPPGALRERLEAFSAGETVRHGFGTFTVSAQHRLESPRLASFLEEHSPSGTVLPAPPGVFAEQQIPGLERAPVLAFLLVILLFAILIGPVNLLMLRKAKRPMLALVTVPAIGLGTTLLMFGYAIVHDGFGVRGVERSWTVLDQVRREAATIATRTLFAGLGPGDFTLGEDSLLLAPAAFDLPDRRSRHRWSYDGSTGHVRGGVLPARTPTPLASARQGVCRDRLRVQVRADGDLDLLTDGGVEPVGDVLLRDRDGGYWFGTAPRLSRLGGTAALDQLERLRGSMRRHEAVARPRPSAFLVEPLTDLLDSGTGLPRGGYITRVAAAPWVPDHGLAVDYEMREHFVIGQLGPEDFVQ
ncbi:MAG: hypothetical protein NXI31_24740 [bacterium]|nr:hypothetical protein [bacterium]